MVPIRYRMLHVVKHVKLPVHLRMLSRQLPLLSSLGEAGKAGFLNSYLHARFPARGQPPQQSFRCLKISLRVDIVVVWGALEVNVRLFRRTVCRVPRRNNPGQENVGVCC